jgi:hypothetical protein
MFTSSRAKSRAGGWSIFQIRRYAGNRSGKIQFDPALAVYFLKPTCIIKGVCHPPTIVQLSQINSHMGTDNGNK